MNGLCMQLYLLENNNLVGAMLALYSVASWRGNDRETAYNTAVPSSACHTRWLGKVDIKIGRQMDNISPVLDHGPRAALGNLIGCHQVTRYDIPSERQGILHA